MALVNNLLPDLDNANSGYNAGRRDYFSNAVHRVLQHINDVSLLHMGIITGLAGSLVGWINPTGYHAFVESCHVP